MATYTENYSLLKPGDEDFYNVEDFNDNMDTIDTLLAENEAAVTNIDAKIGNPGDSGTNTLFGAVANAGGSGSVIKKIKYFSVSASGHTKKSFNLGTVNINKTFVLMERLAESSNDLAEVDYSLSSTSLSVEVSSTSSAYSIGFWVIEFN